VSSSRFGRFAHDRSSQPADVFQRVACHTSQLHNTPHSDLLLRVCYTDESKYTENSTRPTKGKRVGERLKHSAEEWSKEQKKHEKRACHARLRSNAYGWKTWYLPWSPCSRNNDSCAAKACKGVNAVVGPPSHHVPNDEPSGPPMFVTTSLCFESLRSVAIYLIVPYFVQVVTPSLLPRQPMVPLKYSSCLLSNFTLYNPCKFDVGPRRTIAEPTVLNEPVYHWQVLCQGSPRNVRVALARSSKVTRLDLP